MKFWKFWQWPSKIEMMQAHIKALEEQTARQRATIDDVKRALQVPLAADIALPGEVQRMRHALADAQRRLAHQHKRRY